MTAPSVASPEVSGAAPRSLRAKCESRLNDMERVRSLKETRFRDLAAFCTPYSAFLDGQKSDDGAVNVLDEIVFYARATLQAFLHSGMTNPSQQWSQWALPDSRLNESAMAKEWLHTLNERRMILLAGSNFYDAMAWVYGEWPIFATAVVLVEEDERDIFHYRPLPIGSYALSDDDKGNCHAVSRRFTMSVEQLVERFGKKGPNGKPDLANLDRFSRHVQQCIRRGDWTADIPVAHLVCPNLEYRPDSDNPEHFLFASYYWEVGAKEKEGDAAFLAREGYREWPFMVFRWARIPGDPWGTDSPGILTLNANKMVQRMTEDKLMAVEKLVKPPIVVPPGLTVASLLPAARNAVETVRGQMVGPLHDTHPTAVTVIAQEIAETRERIMSLFWTRMILAMTVDPDSRQKTATEVREIAQERLLVLGRMVESAVTTFKQGSDREFAIMQRRGLLPEVPPELEGQPLTIEFTSALAVAQRSVGLQNIERHAMMQGEIAASIGQIDADAAKQLLRRTDWSQLAQEMGIRAGIPPATQRTDEDVEAIERAEQEAMARQQAVEQAAIEAKAARDLASAPLGQDTALDAVAAGSGALP